MALICAAKSCKSHAFENENCNLVFFPFPGDEETCHTWVLRSGRHDLLSRTVEEIHITEFLCERHFEEHNLDRTGPVSLKPKAIPTLFDNDISQFSAEINQEKSVRNSDIVVIPCEIMDAEVNAEVIGYDGESVKQDPVDRVDIERELQLIQERDYVGNNVLSESNEGLDVPQQVITDLQPVENSEILIPGTLVVDSIHAVDTSEWQDGSLTNLANQLCRVCANEDIEMISIFEDEQIVEKIQWHLPIVIKEDDKLPSKICTSCLSLINSWNDLVGTCVEADAKLRKMFKVDQYDAVTVKLVSLEKNCPLSVLQSNDVYCDINSTSTSEALESNAGTTHNVLNSNDLATRTDGANVPVDEISLQAADDSIGLEVSKEPLRNLRISRTIALFNEAKDSQEKGNLRTALRNHLSVNSVAVDNVSLNEQYPADSPSNGAQETNCNMNEDKLNESSSLTVVHPLHKFREESPNEQIKCSDMENSFDDKEPESDNEVKDEPEEIEVAIRIEEHYEDEEDEEEEEDSNDAQFGDDNLSCDICGFVTRKKKNLHQHVARNHSVGVAQFTCEYCDKMFANENSKKLHERTHLYSGKGSSIAAFVCEFCGKSFRTKKTLKEHHISLHSDDRPYKCDKCDKNYGSLSSLDIHKATHSSETPYLCDLCGKFFKHVSNLRSHKRSHLDESDKNRQICLICGKGFRSRFHLSEHMNVHDGNRPYTCDVCGKRFHKKIQLRQHGSAHSGTQPYKCPICGVRFNRRGNMTQHLKRHNQERKYTCRVCSESFPTLGAVLNHRKKHSELEVQKSITHSSSSADDPDQGAFKCPECGKLLAKKESLSIHMRSHSGEKLFPCPVCGKRLSNKGSLSYHMRSFHTGERPHACQFCGDGFLSKEARLVHERIHTGEKPYECTVCGMAFRCSSNLAQHARVHSDARPHPCHTCGKRFQRKGALDVHMRTHTGERPYACDLCGRAFTQKNDMLKHRRTHTHEKPFRCDVCGSIFSQKRDLTKHRASKHSAVDELSGELSPASGDPSTPIAIVTAAAPEMQEQDLPAPTVVITTSDHLIDFPEISVPGIEHTQTVILQRF